MEIYTVANVEEAVEVANDFKATETYNWFRGQVQDRPPLSSLYRVQHSGDHNKEARETRRLGMFFEWMRKVPELQYLIEPERTHCLFAIIQHYGIATHYIDFTTDPAVAGFFAADTTTPPSDGQSCIYCLNTDDLMELWDVLRNLDFRKEASIELVEINVDNLWRLQAQRGVFLFANYNWQIDYPMDRIVFPYSGYPSYPARERIYPQHKSPLEQLLDQYFSLERSVFGNEHLREMLTTLKEHGVKVGDSERTSFPEGFYKKAFIDPSRIRSLESWSPDSIGSWDLTSLEDYHESAGPTIRLKLNPQAGVEEIRKSVTFGVKQLLRAERAVRSKTIDWSFTGLPNSLSQDELDDTLRPVWNGMRRLPYSDEEIAAACGSVVALLMAGLQRERSREGLIQRFSECFGESIRVEFANLDGSSSRGLAALESLRRALRTDLAELLVPEFKEYANSRELFVIIYNPRLMFEFEEFKGMFAREVIPAQAVEKREPIVFNPTRLETFGLP